MILKIFVLVFGVAVVFWGTVSKNSWGVNLKRLTCPRCIHRIPRGPGLIAVWHMWAGRVTCPNCQTLVDKWGHELMPNERDRKRAQRNLPKN